jgi:hypothetical protein
MVYEYKDETLTNLIDDSELEWIETTAIMEIETFYKITKPTLIKEKLVTSLVYMQLAKLKSSDEEIIEKKYNLYEKEFNKYLQISKDLKDKKDISSEITSSELFRS